MTTQLATTPEKPSRVQTFIGEVLTPSKRVEIEMALPAHVSLSRFERNLANAVMREPKIMSVDPRVVFREVAKIAALGLVLDPQLGECWLIVDRNNDIQARVGYRGLIKLSRQSGEVASVFSVDICEKDHCEIVQGTERRITHVPDYRSDRGTPVAYYAVVEFRDGTKDFEVMSVQEIHAIRNRSDAYKAFVAKKIKSTPWATDEGEMAKKTVLRRLLKRCPMSPDLAEALADEDRADEIDMRDVTPRGLAHRMAALISTKPPAEEPDAAGPGDDDGDEDGDAGAEAFKRGAEAKRNGIGRRAVPGEYRQSADLSSAWHAGWDEEPEPSDDDEADTDPAI